MRHKNRTAGVHPSSSLVRSTAGFGIVSTPIRDGQRVLWLILLASSFLPGGLVRAHHSFAPLMGPDGEQTTETREGTVRAYRIMNPHSAVIIDTVAEDGSEESWLLELSPRAQLAREGWTDETMAPGDAVSVAIIPSRTPNRGRLRAILVHAKAPGADAQLLAAYGIRGDTPVMQRLRERLPVCGTIDASYNRTECFTVSAQALAELEAEFPGHMGYALP